MHDLLRDYIRKLLAQVTEAKDDEDSNLLVEPDDAHEHEEAENEVNVAGAVAGAQTPLSSRKSYTSRKSKKKARGKKK